MKPRTLLLLLVVSLFMGGVLVEDAFTNTNSTTLYVFGDSWAQDITTDFGTMDDELDERGFTSVSVTPFGENGTTMREWATDEEGRLTALTNALEADTSDEPVLFFTLGGNDVIERGQSSGAAAIVAEIEADMRTLLDALNGVRDDLQIVVGSYDIVNPVVNGFCTTALQLAFGSTDPGQVNSLVDQVRLVQATVAADYANVTAVNAMGTLQGTPGMPDLDMWSPVQYVASDCIHLNADGYDFYLDTIFDVALTGLFTVETFEIFMPLLTTP